jgi:O-antigen/teichoic acid export membrane protein
MTNQSDIAVSTNRKHRLKIGFLSLALAEIVSRILPIISIRFVKDALGIEGFGAAQIVLNHIDLFLFAVGPGLSSYGAIQAGRTKNTRSVSEIASCVLFTKAVYAAIIFFLCLVIPSSDIELPRIYLMTLVFVGLWSIFDLELSHLKNKNVSLLAVFLIFTKITSFILIVSLIKNADDLPLYLTIFVGTNSLLAITTFLYNRRNVKIHYPGKDKLFKFFRDSFAFNLSMTFFFFLDKVDLFVGRFTLSAAEVGAYAVPLKISQSLGPMLISVYRSFFAEMIGQQEDRAFLKKSVKFQLLFSTIVLASAAIGSLFLGDWIIDILFKIENSKSGVLLAGTLMSALTSIFIYVLAFQVLGLVNLTVVMLRGSILAFAFTVAVSWYFASVWGSMGLVLGILSIKSLYALWLWKKGWKHLA